MLGEDDELLPREFRTAQHAAQLLELGVLAVVDQRPCLGEQRFHLEAFLPELRQGRRDDAAQRVLLERFVTLGAAGLLGLVVRGAGLEEVGGRRETLLAALQLFRTAGADQLDRLFQPHEAALERPQQRMRRAGLPAQQHVRRRPAQLPPRFVGRQPGQRLGEAVAIRLVDGQVLSLVGGQLVRLVEDHQVVRRHSRRRLAQPSERALSHERVDADDHPVALRSRERIAGARVRAPHDTERQREQHPHLSFPVADQAGRRHDQYPPDESAGQHLAQIEAGHDGLACPGVVGEQEPERRQVEHPFIDRDSLMRQRIDQRDLCREGGVEQVAVREPRRLGHGDDHGGPGGEIERRRGGRHGRRFGFRVGRRQSGLQIEDLPPCQARRLRLAVLPAVDGRERDPDPLRELHLRQIEALADGLDARGIVRRVRWVRPLHSSRPTRTIGWARSVPQCDIACAIFGEAGGAHCFLSRLR